MVDTKYSVSWDAYQASICNGLSALQRRGDFVDMTLAADGHHVKVHQMVLSLVSPYIRDLITSASCPNPVIFLNKVSYETLQSILQYAYTGEVIVSNDNMQEFLSTCKDLHIRGLEGCMRTNDISQEQPSESTADQPDTKSELLDEINMAGTPTRFDNYCTNDDDDDDVNNDSTDILNNNEELTRAVQAIKSIPSTITEAKETKLKFTMSNVGTIQIVLNRYLYCFKSQRRTGESLWKCINYVHPHKNEKCLARVIVKDYKIVSRSCAHNHPYHDAQILKKLRNRNMFDTVYEVECAIEKKKKENQTVETDITIGTPKSTKKATTAKKRKTDNILTPSSLD